MSAVGYPDLWLHAVTPDKWRDKIHRLALFPTCYRIVETILVKTQLRVVVQPFYRILRTILCAFAWNGCYADFTCSNYGISSELFFLPGI
jgi:hypothetical protein